MGISQQLWFVKHYSTPWAVSSMGRTMHFYVSTECIYRISLNPTRKRYCFRTLEPAGTITTKLWSANVGHLFSEMAELHFLEMPFW